MFWVARSPLTITAIARIGAAPSNRFAVRYAIPALAVAGSADQHKPVMRQAIQNLAALSRAIGVRLLKSRVAVT